MPPPPPPPPLGGGLIDMPGVATAVTIDGSPVACPRPVRPLRLIAHTTRGIPTFTFSVRGGALPGAGLDPYMGKAVTVAVNGTLRFRGRVESQQTRRVGGLGWCRVYQCLGIASDADWLPHTDSLDGGADTSVYNASSDNQSSSWLPSRAGRTVGQILTDVLTAPENAAALDAAGLGAYTTLDPPTLPSSTTTDLAALTIIPQAPVRFGGERFETALRSFLGQWAPNFTHWWDPSDGALRVLDLRDYTGHTFTLGPDPILPTELDRDVSQCFTRVQVRGERIADMASMSLSNGGLDETLFAHDGLTTAQAKAAFVPANFTRPGLPPGQANATASLTSDAVTGVTVSDQGYGYASAPPVSFTGGGGSGATATAHLTDGKVSSISIDTGGSSYTTAPRVVIGAPNPARADSGTCACPSTTSITVTSINPAARWGANYWDWDAGVHGTVLLASSVTTGVTMYAQRRVVANTSLSPGGTSTLTLDRAVPHLDYDSYTLTGEIGSAANVYTLYHITDADVRANLAPQCTFPFSYVFSGGAAVTQTSTPIGTVIWAPHGDGLPPYEERTSGVVVDRGAGTVRFSSPTYQTAGWREPDDVRALVPVYMASNAAVSPADVDGVPQYSGTAHTEDGLERTLTVTLPSWRDPANLSAVQAYAADLLDSGKDAALSGTITYLGLYEDALTPGLAVSIAGDGYDTGWESAALPVVEGGLEWPIGGPVGLLTIMRCSNRRAHYSADVFMAPDRTGGLLDLGGSLDLTHAPVPGPTWGLQDAATAAGDAMGQALASARDQLRGMLEGGPFGGS